MQADNHKIWATIDCTGKVANDRGGVRRDGDQCCVQYPLTTRLPIVCSEQRMTGAAQAPCPFSAA